MSDDESMSSLERRYRRWMGVFPVAYRARREDEIVGVLLDGASPGQDRPSAAEVLDLVRAATLAHVQVLPASPRRRSWSEAASIIAIVLAVVLASPGARYLALTIGTTGLRAEQVVGWYVPIAWTTVVVLLLLGCTRLACVAAWVATVARTFALVEIAATGHPWSREPGPELWVAQLIVVQLTLAVIASLLLSRPRGIRSTIEAIRRQRLAAAVGMFTVALGVWRWYSWFASGAYLWLLVVPLVIVLVAWAAGVRIRDLPGEPLARRVLAGLAALVAVYWASSAFVDAGGLHVVTRRDLAATFLVGLALAAGWVFLVVVAPIAARRLPFVIARRRS
jgi:hypothetical protein